MKEKQGNYHGALQCLHDVGKYPQALKKALDFKQRGIEVTYTGLTVEDLAYRTARHHQNRQELKLMKECIDLLPDVDDKVRLFKAARLYREAVTLLVKEDLLEDAFRILAAQKQYDGGIKLATSKDQGKQVLRFLLMKARALPVVRHAIREICAFQEELDPSAAAPDLSRFKEELKTDLLPILGEMSTTISKYHLTKECPLLCMEMTILECICHLDAAKMRRQRFSPNVFGMVEQMKIWIGLELANQSGDTTFLGRCNDMKIILGQCEVVVDCFCQLIRIGDIATDISETTCSLQDWYCIQKNVSSVVIPKEQDVWVSFGECVIPNTVTDDGALKLDSSKVFRQLKFHLYHSLKCWLNICMKAVDRQATLPSFAAYHHVISDWTTGHLLEAGPMKDFLRYCCVAIYLDMVRSNAVVLEALVLNPNVDLVIREMQERSLSIFAEKLLVNEADVHERRKKLKRRVNELLAGKELDKVINAFPVKHSETGEKSRRALLSYFAPETSVYIPLSHMHFVLLDEYPVVKEVLLSQYLPFACRDVNAFMSAWWMKGSNELQQLKTRSFNDDYHLNYMGKNIHCFLLWSEACNLLDLPKPKPLSLCRILLDRFFSVVIKRKSLKKFNSVNALVILELLAATLVGMLSCQDTVLRGQVSTFPRCVPHLYEHVVQLFDDSRSRRVRGKRKAVRLMDAVYQSVQQDRNIQGMETEARRFLIEVIELILGMSYKHFNILSHVITGKNNVRNGTLRRYCILLLTLLGNLELYGQRECYQYRHQLVSVVQSAVPTDKESASLVMELCNHLCTAVQTATCTNDLFYFASQLCVFSEKRLAVIQSNDRRWTLQFQPVPLSAVSNVAFPELSFMTHPAVMTFSQPTPHSPAMVQSGSGETSWPEWSEEGQVTQSSNSQGLIPAEGFVTSPDFGTDMHFISSLSQPSEDAFNVSYEYDEEESAPGFDTEEQALEVSFEKEFIKRGWCSVCAMQVVSEQRTNPSRDDMEEQGDASVAEDFIRQHIQTSMHTNNVDGYQTFEELKSSFQQHVFPLVMTILHHPKEKTMQNNNRQFDNLFHKLQKSYQKLQDVLTPNVTGQTSHHFWSGKCNLLKTQAGEVERFALELKGMLPDVEPVAASQVRQESSDDNEVGLELEEQALEDAEGRLDKRGKKHRKKRK